MKKLQEKAKFISFTAPMVRATLGRGSMIHPPFKTQTRRIVTVRGKLPTPVSASVLDSRNPRDFYFEGYGTRSSGGDEALTVAEVQCAYGKAGEYLLVKETYKTVGCGGACCDYKDYIYQADYPIPGTFYPRGWKSSRFMPRHAARITLCITEVRKQRLQDISEEDAVAEGAWEWGTNPKLSPEVNAIRAKRKDGSFADCAFDKRMNLCCRYTKLVDPRSPVMTARGCFAALWDSINEEKPGCAWRDNPWVYPVTYTIESLRQSKVSAVFSPVENTCWKVS